MDCNEVDDGRAVADDGATLTASAEAVGERFDGTGSVLTNVCVRDCSRSANVRPVYLFLFAIITW